MFANRGGVAYGFGNQIYPTMAEQNIEITAYLKTFCGWSEGIRSIFRKYDLEYEEKDLSLIHI